MSFWSTIGTIAGDIGGSFIGDSNLGGQLFGGKNKGGGAAGISKTSPTFRRAEQLGDLSKNYAFDYALPEGKNLLKSAEGTLGQAGTELTGAEGTLQKPLDYYSKLLGGNRADMVSAEAPEIGIINDQAAQQRANISKFTPQGGGQTTALSELPFQQSRDITTLLQKARPDAAQNLEKISGMQTANAAQRGAFGAEQGALSGMVTGEGLQAGGLSLNAISDQINALLGKAGLEIPLQQQTGAGAYQLLKNAMGGGDKASGTDVTGADYSGGGTSGSVDPATGVAYPSQDAGDYGGFGGGFITDPSADYAMGN